MAATTVIVEPTVTRSAIKSTPFSATTSPTSERCATARPATRPMNAARRSRVAVISHVLLAAQEAARPEDEDQHQHAERDQVLQLVRRRDAEALQDQERRHGLQQPKRQAAEHGTHDVADSA